MRKALIIGGARSGIGCANLLNKEGYDVTLTTNKDFKERPFLESKGIHISLNDRDMTLVHPYDCVVKNPGIPNTHPLVKAFPSVLNEIECAYQATPHYQYYAISGTNGKTTTTLLLHSMLLKKDPKALCAGNVGYALSEAVYLEGDFKRDVALEISAFQMEGTPTFAPKLYALLNLSPDHLDRYDDAEDYYYAKCTILPRVGTFVKNLDDANVVRMTQNYTGPVITVSMHQEADVMRKDNAIWYHEHKLFDCSDLRLVGIHNLSNAAFAAVMAYHAGVSLSEIREAIQTFRGVEHRIEYVDEIKGVRFYNDSKATNPESTEVCLKAFDQPIILLAGGYDKHISFELLAPYADKIKKLYVFGESAAQIQAVFPHAIKVETMDEAFELAWEGSHPGDIIVLSPACASYDQFENYEVRGEKFKDSIKTLK